MSDFPDDYGLPTLREELEITQGAPFVDGGPSWLIFDPVRYRFFQIGQRAVELLSLWSAGTVGSLPPQHAAAAGAEVEAEEVSALLKFLFSNSLTESPSAPGIKGYLDQDAAQQRQSIVQKFMQNYLFFRVPLFRPQHFLSATMPFVSPLLTRGFAVIVIMATLLGLYLVSRQWDVFIGQFPNFFSLEGSPPTC